MRTTIAQTSENRVTLKWSHEDTGEPQTREFFAPIDGGYVYADNGSQACEFLSFRGPTLHWEPKHGPLVKMIRREYQRAYARRYQETGD